MTTRLFPIFCSFCIFLVVAAPAQAAPDLVPPVAPRGMLDNPGIDVGCDRIEDVRLPGIENEDKLPTHIECKFGEPDIRELNPPDYFKVMACETMTCILYFDTGEFARFNCEDCKTVVISPSDFT